MKYDCEDIAKNFPNTFHKKNYIKKLILEGWQLYQFHTFPYCIHLFIYSFLLVLIQFMHEYTMHAVFILNYESSFNISYATDLGHFSYLIGASLEILYEMAREKK